MLEIQPLSMYFPLNFHLKSGDGPLLRIPAIVNADSG